MRLNKILLIYNLIIICNVLLISASSLANSNNIIINSGASSLTGSASANGAGTNTGINNNSIINHRTNDAEVSTASKAAPASADGAEEEVNYNELTTYPQPEQTNNKIEHPSRHQVLTSNTKQPKICPGMDIRNDLKSFEQLKDCNIINGPLTIALISNRTHPFEQKDYENITFPQLTEVTEYLLFFRVQGLSALSQMFPNLAVIRGRELVENYALIIYEMMHLQKINLPKLTDILRGSVRIESNPNLCHVTTVNWEAICKFAFSPHFIKDNNQRCDDQCPKNCPPWKRPSNIETQRIRGDVESLGLRDNASTIFCWDNQHCQEFCQYEGLDLPIGLDGECCSPQCSGGCYQGGRPDQCISCRFFSQGNLCLEQCGEDQFVHEGRCITEQECTSFKESEISESMKCTRHSESRSWEYNFKAIHLAGEKSGRCQATCPPGYEEDPSDKNKCKPCDNGRCIKVCTPIQGTTNFVVTNVNSLRELAGCNVINGSLEISMKGGRNVLYELKVAFQELEEIKGFLKITRSSPLVTLGFLSKLKAINGSELDRGQYSLIIIDNPNLQELFLSITNNSDQKQLKISNGKIFVHLNPKLCPHRIEKIKSYADVADWDERDVSPHTNGDKEACTTEKLDVQFVYGTAKLGMIKFQNFALKMVDPRSLLYYLINYREAPNGNVTMFDGRDGCSSQNDVWTTLEIPPIGIKNKNDKYQEVPIKVRPATRYALYVKTFTILAGSAGAISDIIYFTTAPATPGMPRQIESRADSPNSIVVSWLPPSRPNGVIETYAITITKIPEQEDLQTLDVCESVENRSKFTEILTRDEPTGSSLLPPGNSNSASNNDAQNIALPECKKSVSEDAVDVQAEVVSFQDMIIDIVYLKQPCLSRNSSSPSRRKREVVAYDLVASVDTISSPGQKNLPSTQLSDSSIKSESSSLPKTKSIPQQTISFNQSLDRTEMNLPAGLFKTADNRISYIINNLDHFSRYSIEVVACHGHLESNLTQTSKDYKRCGIQAITQVRTHPIEDYDKVPQDSIVFLPSNESISDNIIVWTRPERPNGLILAYRVRYRPKDDFNSEPLTKCINSTTYNQTGGFVLRNISPGTYLFSVQTVSMYTGRGYWSDNVEFDILQNRGVSPIVLAVLIVSGLVVLAFSVAFGTYYYQKKRHELTNGLVYASVNPDYIQYEPDDWEVDKSNVLIGEQIGTGAFGMVYKGQLITEKGSFKCAIKTVPQSSTAKQRTDFLREASIMKQFDTFHVVKLMGVVSITNPVYVIMEYMENGDLKSFLRSLREKYRKENKNLVDGVYLMAAQIADGMAYLASKKFVHRDLAARNCMVGEDQVVKIGDFGLTRDIHSYDYYRINSNQVPLPVRWMAPESLVDRIYTSATDVWSYGIVVWEIVTFSAYPYQALSNQEVTKRVTAGIRLPRPENCPDKLYNIMQRCWRKDPQERPTFIDIVKELLPETSDKLYPYCFYKKDTKINGETTTQPSSEENNSGPESYPLLSWSSSANRVNGLANGVNHVQSDTV